MPRKRLARVRGLGPYRAKLSADRAGPCPCGSKGWRQREGVWEERQGFDGVGGGHTDSEWQEKWLFFFALCCLGKIPGGAPFSQLLGRTCLWRTVSDSISGAENCTVTRRSSAHWPVMSEGSKHVCSINCCIRSWLDIFPPV